MSTPFLKQLLNAPGPSGNEIAPARLWRGETESFADRVWGDVRGNSYALLEASSGPRVLLAGHIDEIGLLITHIDDEGFLSFAGVGGWDPTVLIGQRIRLLGKQGDVLGCIGKKPIHLMKPDEPQPKIENMWIDIGVRSKEEAQTLVRVGTYGVIDSTTYELPNGRVVSRSLDNRIGAYTVLEALRLLAAERPAVPVAAVATIQEEITFAGAYTAAYDFQPQVAIVVDVTHATDYPTADKKLRGEARLGGGPALAVGSVNHPLVTQRLMDLAEQAGISYTVKINTDSSGTDADAIHLSRSGVACGVVSIPNRYMHSPNEMVAMSDVEQAAQLIALFVRSLKVDEDFVVR
jgi:putative aminopeptidase FrvX